MNEALLEELQRLEWDILHTLLVHPEKFQQLRPSLDDFRSDKLKKIAAACFKLIEQGEEPTFDSIKAEVKDVDALLLSSLFTDGMIVSKRDVERLHHLSNRLKLYYVLHNLLQELNSGEEFVNYERIIEKFKFLKEPNREIMNIAQVQAEPVDWLLEGFFAKKAITLIAGEPGVGKTTLLLYLASILSSGAKLFNGTIAKPSKVLFISCEDSLSSKVKPTLELHGAGESPNIDVAEAHSLREIKKLLSVSEHDLIIVDPLTALVSDDVNKLDIAKKMLFPLLTFAKSKNLSIAVSWHLNKSGRILGSIGFEAIAKLIFMLAKDGAYLILTQKKNAFNQPLPSYKLAIREGLVNFVDLSPVRADEIKDNTRTIKEFILSLCKEKTQWLYSEIVERARELGFKRESISVVGTQLVNERVLKRVPVKENGKFTGWLWIFTLDPINLVNLDQSIENIKFEPDKRNLMYKINQKNQDKKSFKINELQKEQEKILLYKKNINLDQSIENIRLEPDKRNLTINLANEELLNENWEPITYGEPVISKGIIGDPYVEQKILMAHLDGEIPKEVSLKTFLAHLQAQADKHNSIKIIPNNVNWATLEVLE